MAFLTTSIRSLCEDENNAIQELGPEVAKVLRDRLADLRAAISIKDILLGNPMEVEQNNFKIELFDNFRLVFGNGHPTKPNSNKIIDWSTINRIKILKIEKVYA